jgi:guanosine-3',5'-bis(diphosphate) 3'-pyrophosphohydrolase
LYSIYKRWTSKHLSFAQVTDIYGFRVIVPNVIDCYTALGVLHQLYKPLPGKFKDHIAISKINGYQSLHTTLVGPAGVNVEFQLRTEAMHLVAESGVAAHWLYKEADQRRHQPSRPLGTKWLQSLLDIQTKPATRRSSGTMSRWTFSPMRSMSLPPRARSWPCPVAPRLSILLTPFIAMWAIGRCQPSMAKQVPLRTELKNGDVMEVVTAPDSTPNPAWLGFVRTGRARSKIRHHLKTLAHTESENLGEKMLTQALRAEGLESLPEDNSVNHAIWDKLLRFSGNKTRSELLTDIGLGKRIASIVAKRLAKLLTDAGQKPDTLLITRERFSATENVAQGGVCIDGSESTSVRFASCCRPIPGDTIVGYLGRGEGLTIHAADCLVAKKLQYKDSERFIVVEWSDEPVRPFETGIVVTVNNGKGVLARVAGALAAAEADITHVDLADESPQGAMDIRFVIAVRDINQLDLVFKNLRRAPAVIKVQRSKNAAQNNL